MFRFKKLFLVFVATLVITGCSEVTELSITVQSDQTVSVGSQIQLESNLDVFWSSANPTIASIDEQGMVQGIAEGVVAMRATLKTDAEIFATLEITVIPVEPIIPEPETVEVFLGIDRIDENLSLFEGKRVGLITNQTGFNRDLVSTIDVLNEKVNLVALFAPEHGIRGDLQAGSNVSSYVDEKTGITVYSLYGSTQKPTAEMMALIDVLCIDIQDAGARFYTYVYTMAYAMKACQEFGKQMVVFDRPNPAGGTNYEGNILDLAYSSFIGKYPIVQRHGMTIGELAGLFNTEYGIGCDLEVILMEGWERDMYYDDTKLPWVVPSPNFPSVDTALVYPGTCIFEGTNMSEGRGTTTPFQVTGAPFIDADKYAQALNDLELPGVTFRPAYFTPTFSKHANVLCNGVQVHVTDRETFMAVKTGWAMLEVARTLFPNDVSILNGTQDRCMLNLLTGNRYLNDRTYSLEEQFAILLQDTAAFGVIRENYLLYSSEIGE